MESFFLSETTKYLYLLFDPDNFIHNKGQHGTVFQTPWGECILDAGGYFFNTGKHLGLPFRFYDLLSWNNIEATVQYNSVVSDTINPNFHKLLWPKYEKCVCKSYPKNLATRLCSLRLSAYLGLVYLAVLSKTFHIIITEAHPIDNGALHCCSRNLKESVLNDALDFDPFSSMGEKLNDHRKRIESIKQKQNEMLKKKGKYFL